MHTDDTVRGNKEENGEGGRLCAEWESGQREKKTRKEEETETTVCACVACQIKRQNEGRDKETSELSLREKTARYKREIKEDIVADYLSAGKEEGGRYKIVASKRERSTH